MYVISAHQRYRRTDGRTDGRTDAKRWHDRSIALAWSGKKQQSIRTPGTTVAGGRKTLNISAKILHIIAKTLSASVGATKHLWPLTFIPLLHYMHTEVAL